LAFYCIIRGALGMTDLDHVGLDGLWALVTDKGFTLANPNLHNNFRCVCVRLFVSCPILSLAGFCVCSPVKLVDCVL